MVRHAMRLVGLAAVCAVGAVAEQAVGQTCMSPQWMQLSPATNPPGRWFGAMVYDSQRQRIVMFGGSNNTSTLGDTWEFDGTNWALRTNTGPGARRVHGMAYDSVRGVTVLFGGFNGANNAVPDTWEWNGTTWTQVATNGPAAGGPAGMTFDSDHGVTVLFGDNGETWEWDGSDWIRRAMTGPGPHNQSAIAYDAARHRSLMFGGSTNDFSEVSDNWAWDGTAWTQLFPAPNPRARRNEVLTYDRARNKLVMFGGQYGRVAVNPLGDTWESDGTTWTQINIPGPSARARACMAFDAANNQMVLFGGEFGLGDTWVYRVTLVNNPVIATQPVDVTVPFHENAVFSVVVEGGGVVLYQWRKDSLPIGDGGRISGSHTATLHINGAIAADIGSYDVVVSNVCTSVTSNAAALHLICLADFNDDGVLTSQDFFDFLAAFFVQDPAADFDSSGTVDSADFFAFLTAFFANCE